MRGLLKKDLILIERELNPVYLIVILGPMLACLANMNYFMIMMSLMISLLLANQVTTTLTLDENAKWRKNMTAMPITAKREAGSKYLLTLMLAVISYLITVCILKNKESCHF